MAPAASAFAFSEADALLQAALAVSLTAINLLRPLLDEREAITDFRLEYVNPAGQRLAGLPERPAGTLRTLFPHAQENGLVDFYRRVFETNTPGNYEFTYAADGHDTFYLVAAQRSGALLVVSLASSASLDQPAVARALQASQDREMQARQAAERERSLLNAIIAQAPVAIGVFQGEAQVVAQANEQLCAMWDTTPAQALGRPLLEGVPSLRGQGFAELIAEVARTGVPYVGREVAAQLPRGGRLETSYYNFVYQPLYDAARALLGVLDIAVDVTEQVLSRHEVQALNEELAATNEELQAANEEFSTNNEELTHAQLQYRQLNQELESRVTERTSALLAARHEAEHQRQRLERFFSQAPAAICILDGPDFVFELVNEVYQQLFPGRALRGRPLLEALPELAGQPVWHTLQNVYTTGRTHEEIGIRLAVARHASGEPEDFYFHYIQQARYDEHGVIDGVLVFALDMTEQVLAQQQAATLQAEVLANAQQRAAERESLYNVFANTSAIICLLRGPEHRIAYYNPAYQALLRGGDMQGRTITEVHSEEENQVFIPLLNQVYRTGETFHGRELPFEVPAANGQPARMVYLDFTYQAYQEGGQTVGIAAFAYDVTEQVLARRQQLTQQRQLGELFEQAPVAIAVLRGEYYVIDVANPLMSAIWGRRTDEVVGRPLLEALPEVRSQGFVEVLDQVIRSGEAFVAHEVPARLERGGHLQTVYLNFVYQPLRDARGVVTGVAVVATEVSEQVSARRQVAQANERLHASNAELDTTNQRLLRTNADLDNFIYTASHDLKAPITNIEGLLMALQEQLPAGVRQAGQLQPLLSMMEGAIERFQKTIAHLTDISRLQQAHAQPPEEVALAEVVDEVRLDLAPELAATQAQLTIDVARCPTISFSPKNLRSIVYNLLSNALKYRAPGRRPVVQLRCHTSHSHVVLEVQDNGLGLNAAQQSQLFMMFQRLHSHVDGSGIGLYMVKKIVENAGGTITVHSEVGVGSTFVVALPRPVG